MTSRTLSARVLQGLAILFSPLLILLALIVKLVTAPFEKPIRRQPEEVAAILKRRLSSTPDWGEWDDFTCIAIADPRLEALRSECVALEERHPGGEAPTYLGTEPTERYRAMIESLGGG